jgi:hypothetical protein
MVFQKKHVVYDTMIYSCIHQTAPAANDNQSINQLHVFLAREEPKKGATPKQHLVIPNW